MRGLLALVAVLAILGASVLVIVTNLAHPWVKRRVVALVHDTAGYDIDYADATLHGFTLVLQGLVVHGAKPLRAIAPTLLQVERVTAELALEAPQLRNLVIKRPALTLLFDEHGRTSFDTPPGKGPAKPPTPLSKQAESVLGARLPLRHVHVERLRATVLRSEGGRVVERDTLRELSLDVDAQPVAQGTRLLVRTSEKPVDFERSSRRARGTLALAIDATAHEAALALHVKVAQQDLVPELAVKDLALLQARAVFANGASEISVRTLELGDGAASAEAELTLPDQGAPRVRHAQGDVDALHLLELAAPWLPALQLRAGTLHYRVDDLTLPPTNASLAVQGELHELKLDDLVLGNATLDIKAKPSAAGLHAEGRAALDRLSMQDLSVDDVSLRFAGTQDAKGVIDGDATLRFAALAQGLRAKDGELVLHARKLIDATHGDVRAEATLASVEAPDVSATNLRLRAHAPLKEARSIEGSLSAESVRTPQQELPLEADFAVSGEDATRARGARGPQRRGYREPAGHAARGSARLRAECERARPEPAAALSGVRPRAEHEARRDGDHAALQGPRRAPLRRAAYPTAQRAAHEQGHAG
ncbi:MAG TPA: hypothetical protein VFX59_00325 [Polyangiales bacterium]|nr:hypothetical protein [Polyangiales bacterium]